MRRFETFSALGLALSLAGCVACPPSAWVGGTQIVGTKPHVERLREAYPRVAEGVARAAGLPRPPAVGTLFLAPGEVTQWWEHSEGVAGHAMAAWRRIELLSGFEEVWEVILGHEMGHLIVRGGHVRLPYYVEEGYCDYVGLRSGARDADRLLALRTWGAACATGSLELPIGRFVPGLEIKGMRIQVTNEPVRCGDVFAADYDEAEDAKLRGLATFMVLELADREGLDGAALLARLEGASRGAADGDAALRALGLSTDPSYWHARALERLDEVAWATIAELEGPRVRETLGFRRGN